MTNNYPPVLLSTHPHATSFHCLLALPLQEIYHFPDSGCTIQHVVAKNSTLEALQQLSFLVTSSPTQALLLFSSTGLLSPGLASPCPES
jgi:hypothetical protein